MEFLRGVASAFVSECRECPESLLFVFSNRRSMLFFQKYLGEESGVPLFSPSVMTIGDFVSTFSCLESADRLELLFLMYGIYEKLTGAGESFDDFLCWGDILLSDFDDVDKYMVDAAQLFRNLSDLRNIDDDFSFLSDSQLSAVKRFWSSFSKDGKRFSDGKAEFLRFWDILYPLYTSFRNLLSGKGIGYEGMIYRTAAEEARRISSGSGDNGLPDIMDGVEKVVFVGMNVPNNCERMIMDSLKNMGRADFYWDYYGDMLCDRDNPASRFMKEYTERYPSLKKDIAGRVVASEDALPEKKNMEIYAVPSGVGQTKLLYGILDRISGEGETDWFRTAVVLPDESLLMPVLDSIPENIKEVNVTMGYPLSFTPVLSFINILSDLLKGNRGSSSGFTYYCRPLLRLFEHPFLSGAAVLLEPVKRRIIQENMLYVNPEQLRKMIAESVEYRKEENAMTADFLENCLFADYEDIADYLSVLFRTLAMMSAPLDREFLYNCHMIVNRLDNMELEVRQDTFFRLFRQAVSVLRIPFRGEPLSGLQIMGTLETRSLDFENVIILSANEGSFPSRSVSDSYIPYNLRKGFGLPDRELQDSIYAYYFYRLIYRARNVYMVYDTRTEGLKSGEMSRYIYQLALHYGLDIHKHAVSSKIEVPEKQKTSISKRGDVMAQMRKMFLSDNPQASFSASSINTYLDCPLKFYYQYVMNVREDDDLVENIEADLFGSIFHETMERIYAPYRGKTVASETIAGLAADSHTVSGIIEECIKAELNASELRGRNIIVRELLRKYVTRTLEYDASLDNLEYVRSEYNASTFLDTDAGKVRIKGFIDRIDRVCGRLRLVDYKTGRVETGNGPGNIESMFDRSDRKRSSVMLQLYLYALLYRESELYGGEDMLDLTVYSLRSMFGENPGIENLLGMEAIDSFKEALISLLNEIFDEDTDFSQTDDEGKCEYCLFKSVCNRG